MTIMRTIPALAILAVAVGGTLAVRANSPEPTPASSSKTDLEPSTTQSAPRVSSRKPAPRAVLVTEELSQHLRLEGAKSFSVLNQELDSATGTYEESTHTYTTSFTIECLDGRTANEFFVCGEARNGDTVVEKWSLQVPTGGWTVPRTVSPTPIGVPATASAISMSIIGGTYVSIPNRSGPPILDRTELYRGSSLASLASVQADPDGRYLLLLTIDRDLYQLETGENSSPVLVFSSTDSPNLADASDQIAVWHHVSLGRIFEITPFLFDAEGRRTIIIDDENDGIFDSITALTADEYDAAGFNGAVWLDDFVFYD